MAVAPDLPALSAKLQEPCVDPGVKGLANLDQAVEVVGETRVYAACATRKHRDTVAAYNNARKKYRGN